MKPNQMDAPTKIYKPGLMSRSIKNEDVRVSFLVPPSLMKRSKKIQWGQRSPALRVLFEKLINAVEKNGAKMIGAVLDGEFEITYKPKGK